MSNTQMNQDISQLILQIENELNEIKKEKKNIDNTILKQMEIFWSSLPIDKQKSLNQKTFIDTYKDTLKAKMVKTLDQAESKLLLLKKQLAPSLPLS